MLENGTWRTRCQWQKKPHPHRRLQLCAGCRYRYHVSRHLPEPPDSQHHKGLETNRKGCLVVNEETNQTTREGVYAGGDAVTGAATVILAMGAGKKAAAAIDEYLKNK